MYIFLGVFLSIGSVACCIALYVCYSSLTLSYSIFHQNGVCIQNIILITVTLLIGISCLCFSLTEKFNRGLLPPAIFFIVIVFYLVSALLASPRDVCSIEFADW